MPRFLRPEASLSSPACPTGGPGGVNVSGYLVHSAAAVTSIQSSGAVQAPRSAPLLWAGRLSRKSMAGSIGADKPVTRQAASLGEPVGGVAPVAISSGECRAAHLLHHVLDNTRKHCGQLSSTSSCPQPYL